MGHCVATKPASKDIMHGSLAGEVQTPSSRLPPPHCDAPDTYLAAAGRRGLRAWPAPKSQRNMYLSWIYFVSLATEYRILYYILYVYTLFPRLPLSYTQSSCLPGLWRHWEGGDHNFEITSISHSQVTLLRLFPSPKSYTPARTPNPPH